MIVATLELYFSSVATDNNRSEAIIIGNFIKPIASSIESSLVEEELLLETRLSHMRLRCLSGTRDSVVGRSCTFVRSPSP